jgi:hypothetical protein
MSCVGFEPTVPASKRAKRVHALDGSATVTGLHTKGILNYNWLTHKLKSLFQIQRLHNFERNGKMVLSKAFESMELWKI